MHSELLNKSLDILRAYSPNETEFTVVEIASEHGKAHSMLGHMPDGIKGKLIIDKGNSVNEDSIGRGGKIFCSIENFAGKNLDMFILDIDGNDFWVLSSYLRENNPKIIVVEYNRSFPKDKSVTIPYSDNFVWDRKTNYYGASARAYENLLAMHGYVCFGNSDLDLYFVRIDIARQLKIKQHFPMYEQKYQFKKEKERSFCYLFESGNVDTDKAFNGDFFVVNELRSLISEHDLCAAIETGTYLGHTTKLFSVLFPDVIGMEIKESYYNDTLKYVGDSLPAPNIIHGNSVEILRSGTVNRFVKRVEGSVLFYLDAHWYKSNPLLNELEAISDLKMKNSPVIIIHDFFVPENPELGCDMFDSDNKLCFELINRDNVLEKIYGENGYEYHYNDYALGAKRGIIYICPKLWQDS
jgi:hypothetical protein